METNNILIVEDDKEIREGVQIYLQSQGYKVFQAADGIEGLEIIDKEDIHLAIVDIMMPRMDGIRMTMKLREKHDFPVIMLSAKSEEVDKITGLNIGADDYVTKPFTPMELMARVNSQLRRYRKFLEKLTPQENVHVIGGLEINEDAVEVTMDGKPVKLTPIEYKILLLLAKNPGAKIYMATTKARQTYADVQYEEDCYIMFGKESAGIPEEILVKHPDTAIRIGHMTKPVFTPFSVT